MSKKWRYKLEEAFVVKSVHLEGISFHNEWIEIQDGVMIIHSQYAWDGCTPAYCIYEGGKYSDGIWIGVWDGPVGKDGKRVTWQATVVHDALCQFREEIRGLTKDKTVKIFQNLLRSNGSPCCIATIYPFMVSQFGPQDWQ